MKLSTLVDRISGEGAAAWDIHTKAQRAAAAGEDVIVLSICLLYTSPSPRDATLSRMPSSA